jgi:hypothetical protein
LRRKHAPEDKVIEEVIQVILLWVVENRSEEVGPAFESGPHDKSETLPIFEFDVMFSQCLESHRYIWRELETWIVGLSGVAVDKRWGIDTDVMAVARDHISALRGWLV